jgi:Ca2+-binding RTX toxin-like protein
LTAAFTIAGGLSMDGFSIDPATGDMYFAINNGSVTDLYKLDSADVPSSNQPVSLTLIGTVNGALPDGTVGDASVDSLSFDNYGNLWGADNDGTLVKIDPATAEVTGGTTLANNEVTGSGVYSLAIAITEDQTFEGGDGNDILTGGSGSDILTGGLGDDLFVWTASDDIDTDGNPADGIPVDVVTDFRDNGDADVIDISDLLVGEELPGADISDYLSMEDTVDGVVLHINSQGELGTEGDTQVIKLDGTNYTDLGVNGMSDADALNHLINTGVIEVDS